jgi:VCBS repeat-containing protein
MSRLRWTALTVILSLCALASPALGQTVSFLDKDGAATAVYVEGSHAIVRVEDPAANVSPGADTVQVQLTSSRAGDAETLTLTETGPATGVFRGEIKLAPGNSSQPGVLETAVNPDPPFDRDTIHAAYGPATATASMVGSKVMFLDPYGRPTTRLVGGQTVKIRLIAPLLNVDPTNQDGTQISLTSANGDQESVWVQETGFDTGVFEGEIRSDVSSPVPYNYVIEAFPEGQTITAEAQDPDAPTTSQATATLALNRMELVDAQGKPADFYLESSRVYVVMMTRGGFEQAPSTYFAHVTADLSGDSESVTLRETGAGTGIFQGSIAMRRGPALANNGFLETTEAGPPYRFDTVRVSDISTGAADAVPTIGSLTSFLDEYGNEVSAYTAGATVVVRVEDHNANNPGAFDSTQAVVQSLSMGDAETLTLQEVARDSGIFEGRIATDSGAAALGDGRLQVQPGETIQAMHTDAYPQLASGALARIDLLKVQFIEETGRPTSELLEGAPVRVRVISPSDNTSSARVDTVTVQIASGYAGDQETVVLAETGADTGVFEGSLPSHYQPGVPGDGTLDTTDSGPPEFRAETVTASVGPYSATAHLVGARVMFIDEFGRPASSFPLGVLVRVRVIDHSSPNDPLQQDYLTAYVSSSYDQEMIYLQETGFNTGVYEGAIWTTGSGCGCGGDLGNGQLSVSAGVTVTASYQNLNRPVDITAQASITGGQVLFLDGAGQPASVYLEGTQARVRVIDHGADLHAVQADTVTVNLATDLSGDAEHLTLTETGQNTGVFEGTIQIRHGSPAANDGRIEPGEDLGPPHHFDTIHASYTASYNGGTTAAAVGVQNFRIWFIDEIGQVTDHYAQQSRLYVRVEDHRNDNPGAFDRLVVHLFSATGDEELLELTETGRATGIFEGSMAIDGGAPAADGRLQAGPGASITAQAEGDYTAEPAQARIDALTVGFIDDTGRPTPELLEGAPVRVRVVSPSDNTGSGRVDTVTAQLGSAYAGDQETVALSETGADTGVFEGSIPSHYQPGVPGDGTLDTTDSGPPEFRAETVTASVGSYSATAHLVGARVMFIDEFGRPASSFPLGVPVRVRVIDLSHNDPLQQDYLTAYVSSSYDQEMIYLQETGFNTGVYEGAILTTGSGCGGDLGNGQLSVSAGVTVTASYQNPNRPVDITAQASITGGQVLFLDGAGQPASVYLEGTPARVRVIDHGADLHPIQADTVTVNLATDLSGDAEHLTLTETGQQTGVFEGTIQIRRGPVLQNSGVIEPGEEYNPPHQFDTVRASYTASYNGGTATAAVGLQNFRLWLIDAYGQVTSHYAERSRVYARLEDHQNDDPGAIQRAYVTVTSSTGDQEPLELVETGRATGIYEGSLPLDNSAVPAADGQLQAGPGTTVSVSGPGFTADPPRAVIDTLSVAFIDDTGRPTSELLEGAPVRVRVVSPSDNTGSARVDTVTAQLASGYAGDQETVVLSETGADTGVFEGSIPSHYHPGVPGDGTLDTTDSGPPEFRAETVTASVGPYSATAHLVGARVTFIDEFGRPVSSFPLGVPLRVRVVDFSSPNDSLQQDSVTAYVSSSYDFELVYLQETGVNTGVYEGEIGTGSQFGFNDGQLMVSAGDTVTASYQNPTRPVDITAQASITGGQVLFLDDAGQPTDTILEGTQARLRVEDHQRSGSVTAQVTTELTGDQETVTLQETSPGAGVFEGSIRMVSTRPAVPNSGSLETGEDPGPPFQYDTLKATYTDSANLTATATAVTLGYRIWFIDASGQVTDHFAAGMQAYVRLEWHNYTDPGAVDTFYVRLTSSSGDEETLQVTETGNDTGIFEGSILLDGAGGVAQLDNQLQVRPGDEITADRDGAYVPMPARARIDGSSGTNRPPVAVDDAADASRHHREVVIDVLANDSDPDGDPLSVLSVTQPDFGVVTINPDKTLTYTVTTGGTVVGQDSFIYVVADPHGGQAVGHVIVQLNRDNHPAVANDDTATVAENSSVVIPVLANDSDPDGDTLTVDVFIPPTHGSARVNADQTVTYTPAADFVGTDSFVYLAQDGLLGNGRATVTVTVTSVNRPPVANADAATVAEDGSVDVAVLANDTDADNDPLTVASVIQGSHGTVSINANGTVRYVPAANYNGQDSFTYTVSDGHGGTATGTVSITVTAVNDPPVANPDSATVFEDLPVDVAVLSNDTDADNDTLSVASVTQGAHGTVMINANGTVRYGGAPNYNGPDSFTYTVSDGHGGTATATVSITVTPVDDPPVANADTATVIEDGTVDIAVLANDTDVENDSLSLVSVTQGAHGTVAKNADGTVTYTPAPDYSGSDSFTYTVSDGQGKTSTGKVTVTVTPVNDPPVANPDSTTTFEESPATRIPIMANDRDPDGDTLDLSVTQPAHGTVVIDSIIVNGVKTVTYTPAPNYNGPDSFTYTISDGHGGSATATVSVTVLPVNDAPVAVDDSATVAEDGAVTIDVLANDSDLEGDPI